MKRYFCTVVFWGAMWGLFEATIGYLLHAMALNIGWLIWFPAAYFFMKAVYSQTGKAASVFQIAVIAAAIKTIDFLLPVRFDMVLNPVASIILEGLSVGIVLHLVEQRLLRQQGQQKPQRWLLDALGGSFIPSISWRAFYLFYVLTLPESLIAISPLRSTGPLLRFLVVESIANGALIFLGLVITKMMMQKREESDKQATSHKVGGCGSWERLRLSPLFVFALLLLAFFTQWMV